MVRQHGIILILAMMYLLAVSLLVMGGLETGWLQANMTQHFLAETHALENAESALLEGEETIHGSEIKGQGVISPQMVFEFQRIAVASCGAVYYQVKVIGSYGHAQRQLESILQIPLPKPPNCSEGVLLRQRVSWHQIM